MDLTKTDNSISIWRYIRPYLKNNPDLQAVMNTNNILPLTMNENTPYPWVIFQRDNISVTYTKPIKGGFDNRVSFSINVYSNDYDESIDIANIIRNILEQLVIKTDEIIINEIEVVSIYEQFSQDGFRQSIQFQAWVE